MNELSMLKDELISKQNFYLAIFDFAICFSLSVYTIARFFHHTDSILALENWIQIEYPTTCTHKLLKKFTETNRLHRIWKKKYEKRTGAEEYKKRTLKITKPQKKKYFVGLFMYSTALLSLLGMTIGFSSFPHFFFFLAPLIEFCSLLLFTFLFFLYSKTQKNEMIEKYYYSILQSKKWNWKGTDTKISHNFLFLILVTSVYFM